MGDSSLTVQAGKRTVDVTGGDYSATSSNAIKLHGKGAGLQATGEAQGVTIQGSGGVGVDIDGTPGIKAHGASSVNIDSPEVDLGSDKITIHGNKIMLAAGGTIEITSTAITISVAGSTIKLDASGVAVSTVSGSKISLNC